MASLGDPPPFEPLKEFFDYLEVEYGGVALKCHPLPSARREYTLGVHNGPEADHSAKAVASCP